MPIRWSFTLLDSELTSKDMMATTTIPTVQLIDEPEAKLKHCPPRITVRDKNPTATIQLTKPNSNAGTNLLFISMDASIWWKSLPQSEAGLDHLPHPEVRSIGREVRWGDAGNSCEKDDTQNACFEVELEESGADDAF